MNQFANLSAESEMSRLAFVSVEETHEEVLIVSSARGVNVAKLTRHNLRVSLSARIDRAELENRVANARTRGNLVALHATIRAECESSFGTIRAREETLANM